MSAFASCPELSAIDVNPNNQIYQSVDGVLFNKQEAALITCPGGKVGKYSIPSGVTIIGLQAFAGCTGLTNVVIPSTVSIIANSAFMRCTGLTELILPEGITTIGYNAFENCYSLTRIAVPESVTSLAAYAFVSCFGLQSVTLPNSVTSISNYLFLYCENLISVTLGDSVTSIGADAFLGCGNLTAVYFRGNAPAVVGAPFASSPFLTVFYRAGTAGWGPVYADRPTALWIPQPEYADWAASTGLTTLFPSASGQGDDPDSDGLTNGEEWSAGTDPTQIGSRLELEHLPRTPDLIPSDQNPIQAGQRAIYCRSIPGRYYGMQRATALGATWQMQAVRLAGATQTRFVLPASEGQSFYRVVTFP